MANPATLILHSGGLRSLVATAVTMAQTPRPRAVLLHLLELRPAAATRLEHVQRQAQHFGIKRVIEVEMPRIHLAAAKADALASHQGATPAPPLPAMQRSLILAAAMAQAAELEATRVVWPVQFNGDVRPAALCNELAVLANHLADTELDASGQTATRPRVDLPLVEMTDRQVIELGAQLDAPWSLAWSCQAAGDEPCMSCEPCRRRHRAFEAAGVVDPAQPTPTPSRA